MSSYNFYTKPEPIKYTYQKLNLKKVFFSFISKGSFLACFFSFILLSFTNAAFFDVESAIGNTFSTGTIDLEIETDKSNFSPLPILKGQTATQSALFRNTGMNNFKYSQEITNTTGDSELCNALKLKTYYYYYDNLGALQKTLKYDGLLSTFSINLIGTDIQMQNANSIPYFTNADYLANEHWYYYEISLPANSDPSLGSKTCNFDIIAKAWQLTLDYGQGFHDEELFSGSITTGSWAKVSGIKFHDKNSNGIKNDDEEILADWNIYQARELEKFNVNSDGTSINSLALESGAKYLIRTKGYYQADTNLRADAKYASQSPYSDWTDSVPGFEVNGTAYLELLINNAQQNWGTYNSDHEYWLTWNGVGDPLTFFVNDNYPENNSGQIEVTIFKVENQVLTNGEGKYEFDLSNLTNEIIIAEEMKTNWIQTYPVKGVYSITNPAIYENYNFGNKYVEPQELGKIVINEVYYDVDATHGTDGGNQSDEWVELYNPNSFAVNLKNWTLQDNSDSRTISNSNTYIPAYGFAVIAKAANTWTFWNIPATAEKISLGQEIGNGLANNGDRLILKDKNGAIVDQISWGTDITILNPSITDVAEGHSIARSPLGFDTDQSSDWIDNTTPNPGTNPHSHILVGINQESGNLLISFGEAYGFDSLKYSINYNHLFMGSVIEENITGESSKPLDQKIFNLTPFYLGTCSGIEGKVCLPHLITNPIQIELIYKNGQDILGTTNLEYIWK